MHYDLTKGQKRALREAAALAHRNDREMAREDRDVHYLEVGNDSLPIVVGGAIARGIIRIEDVGEPARELAADFAGRLRAMLQEAPSPARHEDPHDPNAVVSVSAILAEADLVGAEARLYVNKRSGEVRIVEDEFNAEELSEDDEDDDGPEWMQKARAQAREVAAGDDWVALLAPHDLNDRDSMVRFARRAGPAASRDLLDALSSRGAYRHFREVIRERRMEKEWEAYRSEQLANHLRWLLERAGIPFRR